MSRKPSSIHSNEIESLNPPQKANETCYYPRIFIRQKDKVKYIVKNKCEENKYNLGEMGLEAIKTIINAFNNFYTLNCVLF